jgi:hypothetical protein
MSIFNYYIPSFNGGLQDPLSYSRIDLPQQKFGCRTLTNFIPYAQGPIIKRSGTKYAAHRRLSTATKLRSFESTEGGAYLLEFGDQYVRFFKNKAPIFHDSAKVTNGTFAANITGWTNGSTGTASIAHDAGNQRMSLVGAAASVSQASQQVTSLMTGYTQYQLIFDAVGNDVTIKIGSTAGSSSIASRTFTAASSRTLTFTSNASSFYITFQNPNNNTAQVDNVVLNQQYTVTSPYLAADISSLQFADKEDSIIIVNRSYQPRKLTKTTDTSWAFTTLGFLDGPYYDEKDTVYGGAGTRKTMTPSSATAAGTMTASSATFSASDVGKWIRARDVITNAWGAAKITSYVSSTVVNIDPTVVGGNKFPATTALPLWRMSYLSSAGPWPGSVAIFEDRVFYGNFTGFPSAIFASNTGTLELFNPDADFNDTLSGSTALTLSVPKGKLNWMIANQRLFVGSSSDLFVITGTAAGLSVETAKSRETSSSSSSSALPLQVQSSIIFINSFTTSLYGVTYFNEEDSYVPTLLSGPVSTLFKDGVSEITYQETPIPIIWARTVNNELYGLTYLKDQKVQAWHKHELGGTAVAIQGIAAARGSVQHNLWLATSRTINGGTAYYIEYLDDLFEDKTLPNAYFLDCGITDTSASTTIYGLDHLIGQTVDILKDGALEVSQVVSATGTITLGTAGTVVNVGLPYQATVVPNLQEGGHRNGFSQTLNQKISAVGIRVVDTVNISVGITGVSRNYDPIPFNSGQVLGQAPALFTGTKKIQLNSGLLPEPTVQIVSLTPTPCCITGIALTLDISDK